MGTAAAGGHEEIGGVYAAALTPRTAAGAVDEAALRGLLEFLLGRGIRGFAINGATGEFPRTTEAEFARLMAIAADVTAGRGSFLAGIGAASADASIRLGGVAVEAGTAAVLLPMPSFFPYAQEDLREFVRAVAAGVDAPVLLYNLPQFTSGLEVATSVELIGADAGGVGIVGIKDSSGSLDTVRRLTAAGMGARRLIGNDGVLAQALEERVLDGVVSGVACVLPELILRLYAAGAADCASAEFHELAGALRSFLEQIRAWPTPWGLKVIAEARGLGAATFPMPLSAERATQKAALQRWFEENHMRLLAE